MIKTNSFFLCCTLPCRILLHISYTVVTRDDSVIQKLYPGWCSSVTVRPRITKVEIISQLGQLKHGFLLLRRLLRKCRSLKGENIPLKEWTIFVWKDLHTTSLSFFWSLLSSDESEELLPELLSESESESELLPLEEDC